MASQGDKVQALDLNDVINLANTTLIKYGYSSAIPAKTALVDYIGGSVYVDLVNGLTTINSNANCLTPVAVTDLDNYNRGEKVFATLINLLVTKYNTVSSGFCTCNCNFCSCNGYCSCNCNRCSCNCNYCSCNCNKSWSCSISSQHTCFANGQLIHTSRGVIPIESVVEGDYLYDAYTNTFGEVSATWKIDGEMQNMVRIGGQGFEIFVTENHPLPLYNTTTEQIEVIQPSDIGISMITDYMALYPIPQIKNKKYHQYNTDIDVYGEYLKLIPYLVLFYKNNNFYCTCDKVLDRIEENINSIIADIRYERLNDGLHVNGHDHNIIEGRSVHQIFEMTTSHGIPNWIFEFDEKSIADMLTEFEFIF